MTRIICGPWPWPRSLAGRVSHNSLNSSGHIIAPSPLRMQGQLYVEGGVKEHFSMPQVQNRGTHIAWAAMLPSRICAYGLRFMSRSC